MDGKDAFCARQLGGAVFLLQQVDGDQGGLPVVAVDDVRGEVQLAAQGQHCPGEKGEALAVVKVAVELLPLEVVLVVHEPEGDAVPFQPEHAAVSLPPGQSDVEPLEEGHLSPPVRADALIQGQDDGDIVPRGGQRLGQRTGHVRQTAGLDEGGRLGRGKENFHGEASFLDTAPRFCAGLFCAHTMEPLAMARG